MEQQAVFLVTERRELNRMVTEGNAAFQKLRALLTTHKTVLKECVSQLEWCVRNIPIYMGNQLKPAIINATALLKNTEPPQS